MIAVGSWVGELTPTVGQGPVVMTGPMQGFAAFDDFGEGEYWYAFLDGFNRETGIGRWENGVFYRDTIHATLINGLFDDNNPPPLSLSGNAEIYSTFNKVAFDIIFAHIEDELIHFPDVDLDGVLYGRQDRVWTPIVIDPAEDCYCIDTCTEGKVYECDAYEQQLDLMGLTGFWKFDDYATPDSIVESATDSSGFGHDLVPFPNTSGARGGFPALLDTCAGTYSFQNIGSSPLQVLNPPTSLMPDQVYLTYAFGITLDLTQAIDFFFTQAWFAAPGNTSNEHQYEIINDGQDTIVIINIENEGAIQLAKLPLEQVVTIWVSFESTYAGNSQIPNPDHQALGGTIRYWYNGVEQLSYIFTPTDDNPFYQTGSPETFAVAGSNSSGFDMAWYRKLPLSDSEIAALIEAFAQNDSGYVDPNPPTGIPLDGQYLQYQDDPVNPGQGIGCWNFVDSSGGGGGVTVHDDLTGKDAVNQHPTSSITGLDTKQASQDAATALVQTNLTTHEGDTSIHFADAPVDGTQYARKDAAWEAVLSDPSSLPVGGTTGQQLVKNSDTNFDAGWVNRDVKTFIQATAPTTLESLEGDFWMVSNG